MWKRIFAALLLTGVLAGCISYEYTGIKENTPTTQVKVFTDPAKIEKPYVVLGSASASGYYMDVTKEQLQKKLVSEAEKCGANAILITAQQVLPYKQMNANPSFNTAFDYDNQSSSWRQLYRDFDLTYGSVRGTPNDNRTSVSYRRILRAEFLKFTSGTAPAKNPVAKDEQNSAKKSSDATAIPATPTLK